MRGECKGAVILGQFVLLGVVDEFKEQNMFVVINVDTIVVHHLVEQQLHSKAQWVVQRHKIIGEVGDEELCQNVNGGGLLWECGEEQHVGVDEVDIARFCLRCIRYSVHTGGSGCCCHGHKGGWWFAARGGVGGGCRRFCGGWGSCSGCGSGRSGCGCTTLSW